MHFRRTPNGTRRRGVILLIVLAMLTLFAIAGLTFVLYAEAASESARINCRAETFSSTSVPDMDPNAAFSLFLSQFIYGVTDPTAADQSGAYTALRGHSLAETMDSSFDAAGPLAPPTTATTLAPSDVPYNGTGRLHETTALLGTDPYQMVNYTYFSTDGFLRDPARPGTRVDYTKPRTTFTGGQNAPYTYFDLNSMFLASIRASDGMVLLPSYHRDWAGFGSLDPSNGNWYNTGNPALKYLTLRPRPADMNPPGTPQGQGFPAPLSNAAVASVVPAGDVKNLVGMPGGNDSIWIDIGAPELYTSSGLRYKMLVAPLILDLDSRVNVNVAGNVMGAANVHAGNQAWGPWEINLSKVLNPTSVAATQAAASAEWQSLFLGSGATTGRYGAGKLPTGALTQPFSTTVPPQQWPHVYFPGDLNGLNDPGQANAGQPTGLYALPGQTLPSGLSQIAFQGFPNFPTNGYGNNQNGYLETTASGTGAPYNHAMAFNPLNATATNKLLTIQNNANILWAGVNASSTTDLVQLCGKYNFVSPDPATDPKGTTRRLNLTTVLSMDLDRSGAAPYDYDPTAPAYSVTYTPGTNQYSYGTPATNPFAIPFPPLASRATTPANSEFDPTTWRSVLPAALARIDLNRTLAPYSTASGWVQPPDRQQFAQDIYTRLVSVTGMTGVNSTLASGTAISQQQYNTLNWLAQLSANIVDYIDTDDVMTSFQWTTHPMFNDKTGYVFGTELPKLVLNEVYLQYQNDPTDTFPMSGTPPKAAASKPYQMNVWAELLNPLPSDTNAAGTASDLNGSNQAVLQNAAGSPAGSLNAGTSIYQVVITQPNLVFRDQVNVLGDPDNTPSSTYTPQPLSGSGTYSAAGAKVLSVANTSGGAQVVTPVGTNYSGPSAGNQGFYVLGPQDTTLPSSYQTTTGAANSGTVMTYTVPLADGTADAPVPPTVLLRRLANPNLPYQSSTIAPNYNPYVTVDYVDMQAVGATVNDARTNTAAGKVTPAPTNTNFASYGRTQPYAASAGLWKKQQPNTPSTGPQNTFFRHNAVDDVAAAPPQTVTPGKTLKVPFDWLVHLDRPLVSPVELLHVSGFKPHELTQQFVYNDGTPYGAAFNHVAPWQDPNSRLYRLLEFVKVKNLMPGVVAGGRVPGKININTIDKNSPEVFRALCDAEPGNLFYYTDATGATAAFDANVDQVFQSLMTQRTPGAAPAAGDQPFWGMAMGADTGSTQYPAPGVGIANTLLAPVTGGNANSPRLLTPTALTSATVHPYDKLELLNKVFNNLTTRSNVVAVWLTVGFFQITNDHARPMQLGAEINLAQGKNIRHHMFAVVDRTQIQTWTTGTLQTTAAIAANPAPAAAVSLSLASTSVLDSRTGRTWQIQDGTTPAGAALPASTLVYDPGLGTEETVIVQPGFKANFTQAHAKGANVVSRGHPGPWTTYSPSQDASVVPYWVIID